MTAPSFWVFYDSYAKIQSNFMSTSDTQDSISKMRPEDIKRYLIWTEGWENWQPLKAYLESDQKNFFSSFSTNMPTSKADDKTVKEILREVLEKTQTQAAFTSSGSREETSTKSYSSINLNEETISRIIRQEQLQKENINADGKTFNIEDITWSNIQKPDLDFSTVRKNMDKREVRHELKIEVLLISARGKTFRSRSKNISLSGSLLEDKIPFDYYDSKFEAVIINSRTGDPLKARVKLLANIAGKKGDVSQRIYFINVTDQQKLSLQLLLEDYIKQQKKR